MDNTKIIEWLSFWERVMLHLDSLTPLEKETNGYPEPIEVANRLHNIIDRISSNEIH